MRGPPAFRLLALAMGREVSTVDWPLERLAAEGPACGVPVIDRAACISCGDCVGTCPSACLHMPEGGGVPTVDAGPCARCGMCVAVCGEDAIAMDGPRDLAVYDRADLNLDGSPAKVREVVRSPSRIYRLATDHMKQDVIEPDTILDRRKEKLERR